MAFGAVTWVASLKGEGPSRIDRFTIVGVTSYTTGGDTGLAAAIAALSAINDNRAPKAIIAQSDVTGYVCRYNPTTDKFIVLQSNDDNTSDGPLIEVASTTDIHTSVFDCWILSE